MDPMRFINCINIVVGSVATGKTTYIKNICNTLVPYHKYIYIIEPTESLNNYHPNLYSLQLERINKYKKYLKFINTMKLTMKDYNYYYNKIIINKPSVLIVLDDIDIYVFRDKEFRELLYLNRHLMITFIISLQVLLDVPPTIRNISRIISA